MSKDKSEYAKDLDKIRQETLHTFDDTNSPTELCLQAHAKWRKARESLEQRVEVINALVDTMDICNNVRPQDIEAYSKFTAWYTELLSRLATADALITMVNRGLSDDLALANTYAAQLLLRKVD